MVITTDNDMRTRSYSVLSGAGAGAGAALIMIAMMAIMRLLFGLLTIPELMLNTILKLMGGQAFSDALDRLYYAGRPLLFATILEGVLLLGSCLGLFYALISGMRNGEFGMRYDGPDRYSAFRIPHSAFQPPWGGILYGLLIGVLLNIVFLPIVGQPPFADEPSGTYVSTVIPLWLGLLALAVVYGLALQALLPNAEFGTGNAEWSESDPAFPVPNSALPRRDFFRLAGGVLLALAGGTLFTLAGTSN